MRKKGGIGRTLKYGGIYAERVFFMIFFMVAVYGIIYYFQGGVGEGNNNSLMTPVYFGIVSLIVLAVIQLMNNTRYIPISISFGSPRKETFIGTQWINLILIVQCIAVLGIYFILVPSNSDGVETLILFLYVILLVIFSGLGQLIGAASIKFGKVGAFLIAMFVLIIIITGIVAIALVGEFNVEISINGFSLLYKFIAVFVAVIVYLCGAYINYLVLKNYEVRA